MFKSNAVRSCVELHETEHRRQEHAVVHPMRHRVQLQRLLSAADE